MISLISHANIFHVVACDFTESSARYLLAEEINNGKAVATHFYDFEMLKFPESTRTVYETVFSNEKCFNRGAKIFNRMARFISLLKS